MRRTYRCQVDAEEKKTKKEEISEEEAAEKEADKEEAVKAPLIPKWATFPDFYFPKRYVKSNKNTLCNPYLYHKTMKSTHSQ